MKLEHINKIYNIKNKKINVLNDINYEFSKRKFYVIKGHSGAGKTTLIKILGLLINPSSGRLLINNEDVSRLNSDELADLRMSNIGFIFQDYNLDYNLTAIDNVMLPMLINPNINKKDRKMIAETLLIKLGLQERINHYPRELSGGEQQRVAIARALANDPDIILADEPTGNLDEKNEELVFQELKKLSSEGKCVIVVTHSNEMAKYADEILLLKDGLLIKAN